MKAATGADYARICAKHNLPISKNQIGDSGEKILGFALSYFPFFNLYFLMEKLLLRISLVKLLMRLILIRF